MMLEHPFCCWELVASCHGVEECGLLFGEPQPPGKSHGWQQGVVRRSLNWDGKHTHKKKGLGGLYWGFFLLDYLDCYCTLGAQCLQRVKCLTPAPKPGRPLSVWGSWWMLVPSCCPHPFWLFQLAAKYVAYFNCFWQCYIQKPAAAEKWWSSDIFLSVANKGKMLLGAFPSLVLAAVPGFSSALRGAAWRLMGQ